MRSLGFTAEGSECGVQNLEVGRAHGIWGFGIGFQGFGSELWGLGFEV